MIEKEIEKFGKHVNVRREIPCPEMYNRFNVILNEILIKYIKSDYTYMLFHFFLLYQTKSLCTTNKNMLFFKYRISQKYFEYIRK